MSTFQETRKSHVEHGVPYFWTATINGWKHLLKDDAIKMEIIQSLQWLTERNLIDIYAYVIMPNHLHFIWQVNSNNGRESPQGSLLKFTAHRFRKILYQTNRQALQEYEVSAQHKLHEFWQPDSLAIPLYTRSFLLQKITYIHNNPLAKHWKLADHPAEYRFSSAGYYENGKDEFEILTHIADIF